MFPFPGTGLPLYAAIDGGGYSSLPTLLRNRPDKRAVLAPQTSRPLFSFVVVEVPFEVRQANP